MKPNIAWRLGQGVVLCALGLGGGSLVGCSSHDVTVPVAAHTPAPEATGTATATPSPTRVPSHIVGFETPVVVPVGLAPVALAVGDVDGDGRPDLVSANRDAGTVSVLLRRSGRSFVPASGSPIAVGLLPQALAIADLDGDGRADLVTANRESNNLTLLLGQGGAGFAPAANSPLDTGGSGPWSVAVADVNDDSRPDIVAANFDSDTVSVLLGNGSGGFAHGPGSPFPVGSMPDAVAVADVDLDGRLDLVTANYSGSVSVLFGAPDRSFVAAPGSPFSTAGGEPFAVAVADLDGDAWPEIVAVNRATSTVSVFAGPNSRDFALVSGAPFSAGGANPFSVAVADMNDDGLPDLVTANSGSNDVSVLLQTAEGFEPAAGLPFSTGGDGSLSGVVADLDGDGLLDVATANEFSHDVSVLFGRLPSP